MLDSLLGAVENWHAMRSSSLITLFVLTLSIFAYTQQPSASSSSGAAQASAGDRSQVEATLKKYEAAYQHMSLYELQQVWPDLPNQKKEYRNAEDLLKRGNVSDVKVAVEVQDVQVNGDNAVVKGVRSEEYLKNEKSSYYGGDLRMEPTGTRTAGPSAERSKHLTKKSEDVTIHLQRKGDSWIIASMEEAGKHH